MVTDQDIIDHFEMTDDQSDFFMQLLHQKTQGIFIALCSMAYKDENSATLSLPEKDTDKCMLRCHFNDTGLDSVSMIIGTKKMKFGENGRPITIGNEGAYTTGPQITINITFNSSENYVVRTKPYDGSSLSTTTNLINKITINYIAFCKEDMIEKQSLPKYLKTNSNMPSLFDKLCCPFNTMIYLYHQILKNQNESEKYYPIHSHDQFHSDSEDEEMIEILINDFGKTTPQPQRKISDLRRKTLLEETLDKNLDLEK